VNILFGLSFFLNVIAILLFFVVNDAGWLIYINLIGAVFCGWVLNPAAAQPAGEVVVTKNESGQIVAVTRQDEEGRILSVIAESDAPQPAALPELSDAEILRIAESVPDKDPTLTQPASWGHGFRENADGKYMIPNVLPYVTVAFARAVIAALKGKQ